MSWTLYVSIVKMLMILLLNGTAGTISKKKEKVS